MRGMVPRWSRRGTTMIPAGDSGSSGATRMTFGMDRSYSKSWRLMKPNVHSTVNPINWSIAFQTAVLIISSACMLVYILLSPADGGGVAEEDSAVVFSTKPAHNPHGSMLLSSTLHPSRKPLGPTEKETGRERGKESDLVSSVNATVSMNSPATVVATAKTNRRDNQKMQLRRIADDLEIYSDPTARYYPLPTVCRVFNGCLEADGTMVLRDSLKDSRARLRACGMMKVKFESEVPNESNGKDFFTNVLRYHMPHLVTDILSLSYAMSVVRGEYLLDDRVSQRTKNLKPVVVGQDRIRSMSPGAWTLKMLAKLPYQTRVKTKGELFMSQLPPSTVQRICFRSIVTFDPQIYWQVNPSRFLYENSLFSQNKLWTRNPRRRGPPGSLCSPVVTVLNRPPGDQRTLSNVGEIEKSFEQLRGTQEYSEVAGAALRIEYMNSSFHQQMRIVQHADVILASHGAALANLLFSRVQTPVIEVFPFTYYANIFERMAKVMSLRHESIIAKPDGVNFFACVVKQNTDRDATTVRNVTAFNLLKSKWEHAAKVFETDNDHRVLQFHQHHPGSDVGELESLRMCSRNQVLEVDAKKMARRLLTLALSTCQKSEVRSGNVAEA